MMVTAEARALIITGSMGAGKSAVAAEISDLLAAQEVPHAVIDLDALKNGYLPGGVPATDLAFRNLADVWKNYAVLGIRTALIPGAIETAQELQLCREALPGVEIVPCRVRASLKTMQERVRSREPGIQQDALVERVKALEEILDSASLESFSVSNQDRSITDVAREILYRAGWGGAHGEDSYLPSPTPESSG